LRKDSTTALAQTAAAAILWGTSFPVITLGIRAGLDPLAFAFLRFALASAIMLGMCRVYRKEVGGLLRSRAVWIIGFFDAVGYLCQYVGQAYTSASVASLLVNLSVVLAALGGVVFLGERIGGVKATGVVAAVVGTVLLTTKGDLSLVTGGQLFGDAQYLVAAVSWAAYIVYGKKKTDETAWDPVAASAAIVAVTTVFILPVALFANWTSVNSVPAWEAVAYTAIFNTAIAFALYQSGLRYLTATSSAVVLMLEIVTAMAISTIFLGEEMNLFSWAGAALVLVSVLLVSGFELGRKELVSSGASSGAI
jgi:drug/metabolite transporter (DMT)-like permease